jgi:hypothetical protein
MIFPMKRIFMISVTKYHTIQGKINFDIYN